MSAGSSTSWKGPHFATWHLEGLKPGWQATVVDMGAYATARLTHHCQAHATSPLQRDVTQAQAWAEDAAHRAGAIV